MMKGWGEKANCSGEKVELRSLTFELYSRYTKIRKLALIRSILKLIIYLFIYFFKSVLNSRSLPADFD